MQLSQLAADCKITGPDKDIAGLACDSRNVKKDYLFAAFRSEKFDGRAFIPEAIKNGAIAILGVPGADIPEGIAAVSSNEPRRTLSLLASRFYPLQPAMIAAVTGTSGKTSVVQFARQIWQTMGHKAATIGTLGIIGNGIERYGSLTTPDCISLHQNMQMLAEEKNITHTAIEASSHGLAQFRLDGLRLKIAAFTNLSRDHLDYHKTMEAYFAVKRRLFSELLPADGVAVLRRDIPEYENLSALAKGRGIKIISFGRGNADLDILSAIETPEGQELNINFCGRKINFVTPLTGAFQGLNLLCAAGIAIASGEDADKVASLLPHIKAVRGRMERVGTYNDAQVIVDYAHKPDALENVLQTLRAATNGKLVVVFGCGGNRDVGKRPIMGEIAARLADIVVVTDDNPRDENPSSIRAAIMQACPAATEIADRAEAICHAISLLNPSDAQVIAGKGHEQGQIVGENVLHFDDAEVARGFIKENPA